MKTAVSFSKEKIRKNVYEKDYLNKKLSQLWLSNLLNNKLFIIKLDKSKSHKMYSVII